MATQPPKEQTKLLICGSRHNVSESMILQAKRATLAAYHKNWVIYTGDAIGVDKVIAEVMKQFILTQNDSKLVIAGLANTPRHGISGIKIAYDQLPARNFTERDRYMVENTDKIMCIWNGKSESSGTYKNYLYACELNKQAWLINEHGKIVKINEA